MRQRVATVMKEEMMHYETKGSHGDEKEDDDMMKQLVVVLMLMHPRGYWFLHFYTLIFVFHN